MIEIIHQHLAAHQKPSPFADLPKSRQEALPILIVQENRFAPITPAQQMIEGALIPRCALDAGSAHKSRLAISRQVNAAHMHGLTLGRPRWNLSVALENLSENKFDAMVAAGMDFYTEFRLLIQ